MRYVFVAAVLFLISCFAYVKITQPFWSLQPVFHVYDLHYFFYKPRVMYKDFPESTKYTNLKNIETTKFSEMNSTEIEKITNFVQQNYLGEKGTKFDPKVNNIVPYFRGATNKSIWSCFYETELNDIGRCNVAEQRRLVGVVSSRPINIIFKSEMLNCFYVDYLCVDKLFRKKGVAPQLIQTHDYNQRRIDKTAQVSVFKREQDLTGIVPIVAYTTYGFSMKSWRKPMPLSSPAKSISINKTNFHIFWEFLERSIAKFELVGMSEASLFLNLIESDNIYIYVVVIQDTIKSAYFFRKSCTYVQGEFEVISCYATINDGLPDDVFIRGFKQTLWETSSQYKFGYAAIEDISDTTIIINDILKKNKAEILSPTGYFLYNFIHPTVGGQTAIFLQ
tara:strand:+ start:95 stop:1270 length:1176 start_codon:yes stop_codon:yes gene_type:complete